MKHRLKLIIGSVLGLALYASAAHAALVLSGNTAGAFEGVSSGNTQITNSADGMSASFRTGVPIAGSFMSGVVFEGQSFANVTNGDVFSLGMFTYYNGITRIGTSSAASPFNFSINLDNPAVGNVPLTTINFGIDATINDAQNHNPDQFTAMFTQPPPILIDGTWVTFAISGLPAVSFVKENTLMHLAQVTVHFREMSPVPEPSTYGLIGAAGLLGLATYRRFRARRGAADFALPTIAA